MVIPIIFPSERSRTPSCHCHCRYKACIGYLRGRTQKDIRSSPNPTHRRTHQSPLLQVSTPIPPPICLSRSQCDTSSPNHCGRKTTFDILPRDYQEPMVEKRPGPLPIDRELINLVAASDVH